MQADIASMEFSSGRKLKTYGRASRNIVRSPFQRTLPERFDQDTSPTPKDVGISRRDIETPRKALHRGNSETTKKVERPRLTVPKIEGSIYDIPSSDDDTQNRSGRERKRRRLETPTALCKFSQVDRTALVESRERPQQVQIDKPLERQSSAVKRARHTVAEKSPRVGVVIQSPPSAKANGTNQFDHDQRTLPGKKPLSLGSPSKQPLSARSWSHRFRHDPGSRPGPTNPAASVPANQPVRPSLSRSPSQKLKEMTQHLSTESYVKTPLKRSLTSEKEGSIAGTPRTSSRLRLIDALNTGDMEDTESSSDPDTVRSDLSHRSRNNSRASSRGPPPTKDSVSTNIFPSVNPRRRRPEISNQLQQNTSRVTYARQRSFRTEGDMDTNMSGMNDMKPTSASKADPLLFDIGTSLLPPKLVPNLQEPDDNNDTGPGMVRSIYELRRAGGNARYQAVIESIFEDLEEKTASTSRKRSGFFQLCSKLVDTEFSRRFISNSLEKRLSECTVNEPDMICTYLTVCIYTLLLASGPTSPVALQTCFTQILDAAPSLLPEERDILQLIKLPNFNMSKAGQSSLRDLCVQLRENKLWSELPPARLSPQNLELRSLELAVRKVREAGDRTATVSNPVLAQIVDLLLQHSREGANSDLFVLEMAFSILESYTVGLPSLDSEQERILNRLSRMGLLLAQLIDRSDAASRQIQILQIRLILNITNNNPALCEDFATPDMVGALARLVLSNFRTVAEDLASDKKESLLDTVILALGTLINLTEWSSRSRGLFLQMKHGPAILVDRLMELFIGGLETVSEADSVVQTHSNVAFGYLSVLLSTLCLDDEVRTQVRRKMRGNNLSRLLAIVEEFLHYHRKVEEELKDPVLEEDAMAGFTSRLQSIVERIHEAEGLRR
ncbi:hypothetical protein CPC735_028610 [Coccidioides posadasii C735 delta SOWgp]|uniref:Wings apart-like protein C-terminal domain-containing protein n=1 Tax=Coccidioides posadasii (strain C735) TaxID=222929 RepID=C5P7X5_COCP7|nr:hypothetical protein CPC735_028610 [Coccidioides posadasii C735 delta SOWgp]EER27525.1 hypothetical protein CPC735_028610 [Coccidioides posadasii C735 delta SOWgp]|eukprot:XP_003069670.1 hypothetical protein CPC735_028610 [Coccidioides posadasii C735 delta SOWgp]